MEGGSPDFHRLALQIKHWAVELGFQQAGIAGIDLSREEGFLQAWLNEGRHGEMEYMARHGLKRSRPAELVPGTLSVISVRLDYLPPASRSTKTLADPVRAFISRYAQGRDYHKLMRDRLQRLAERIQAEIGPFGYRAFSDSAPVLEKALAQKAGLGWIGKHTNLINPKAGSWFFLGELYTSLPLPPDSPALPHCGRCTACMDICPTRAIVAPFELDARRCISYLSIELPGPIPLELRPLLGNRIYGCDDCQLICPWNRFARPTGERDFHPRQGLDRAGLIDLFGWNETEFLQRLEGSPIRRIGHQRWLRNIAVALGNAPKSEQTRTALLERTEDPSELVREHVAWALARQTN
ncbi:MAG: tRNA epoxyqueuosine(34) reductase QueG [Gallionellales bacterium RIFOXYB12_FULL_54_9]|nr:MAG: tRNA epoxyqueuosine(34) reductase QueG [Gallionellales bacterium RIFOXYB12_FULL_54_9]OGT89460.1 MAG: tRNA epoxyqueuosine(34) reductase QueG [Gammaproteobacteria bacterium RIFOXYA12_FULL_61_12]OGT89641.1 MAG: tRNA epoxyqueuosine(34) reductase QueG [Gammaproteobacteria bacterium RIFOXYD12_FULL_61_37]